MVTSKYGGEQGARGDAGKLARRGQGLPRKGTATSCISCSTRVDSGVAAWLADVGASSEAHQMCEGCAVEIHLSVSEGFQLLFSSASWRCQKSRRTLVAIAGAPGSGKSTLADEIVVRLNETRGPSGGCSADGRISFRRQISLRALGLLDRQGGAQHVRRRSVSTTCCAGSRPMDEEAGRGAGVRPEPRGRTRSGAGLFRGRNGHHRGRGELTFCRPKQPWARPCAPVRPYRPARGAGAGAAPAACLAVARTRVIPGRRLWRGMAGRRRTTCQMAATCAKRACHPISCLRTAALRGIASMTTRPAEVGGTGRHVRRTSGLPPSRLPG